MGRETEKNPTQKSLNGNILSTDILTLPTLHEVAHIECSASSGKRHEPLTGVWEIQ